MSNRRGETGWKCVLEDLTKGGLLESGYTKWYFGDSKSI
jgi:hypothetical protein